MVREWDPRTASSAEIESLLETLNAVFAADLPDDPQWRNDSLREYLSEVMPGERRISWVVRAASTSDGLPSPILGHVQVLLLDDTSVIEVLVHPRARHHGLGRRLLATAAHRAYQEGSTSIKVEVVGGTAAVRFYESLGFAREYLETRSVLRLAEVDWPAVERMIRGLDEGFRLEFHPGGPPDALLDAYARAKAEAREADEAEPDLHASRYEPEQLRDSLDCLLRRGMQPYIVLAIVAETGRVAGLTEVVVPAQHPTRADQYDTLVVPAHRDQGIERAVKARMLLELRTAEPHLSEVQTWNTAANEAMREVNTELGFQPDREWCEYGISVAELVHRLDNGD